MTEPEVIQQVLDLPERGRRITQKIDKQPEAEKISEDDSLRISRKTTPEQPEVVASQEPAEIHSQSEDAAAEEPVHKQTQSQSEVAPSQEPVHSQSEEVEAEDVRITHQSAQQPAIHFVDKDTGERLHPCVCPPEVAPSQEPVDSQSKDLRITHQTSAIVVDDEEDNPLVIDVDEQLSRITQVEGLISETVEIIDLERDPEEEDAQKIKTLKRKHLGSRKSPRVKIQKMDLSKGVSSALSKEGKSAVDFLAKSIMKNIKNSKPVSGRERRDQSSVSSSSQSSSDQQKSSQQRSVLQMFAQAALGIKKSGKKTQPVVQPPQPQQSQKPVRPPPLRIPQAVPQRITQKPVAVPRRITQADPEKGIILRCTYCAYTTHRKESLNDHLRMHTGEKIKCPKCDKDYYSKKSFRNHFKIIHQKRDRCFCTEEGCTWSGKDYGNRKVHLYEEHGIGEAPVCEHPDCKDRGHFSNFRTT